MKGTRELTLEIGLQGGVFCGGDAGAPRELGPREERSGPTS
jgi:hypothetical protein